MPDRGRLWLWHPNLHRLPDRCWPHMPQLRPYPRRRDMPGSNLRHVRHLRHSLRHLRNAVRHLQHLQYLRNAVRHLQHLQHLQHAVQHLRHSVRHLRHSVRGHLQSARMCYPGSSLLIRRRLSAAERKLREKC